MHTRYVIVLFAIAGFAAALLAGCPARQGVGPVPYNAAREYAPEDYERVLGNWTRRADIYDQFQSLAFVTATLMTPDFRRAYDAAYVKIMDLSPAEAARKRSAEAADAAAWHEVTLVMYTTDRRWNDLDVPGGIWKVRLEAASSGVEEPPVEVRLIRDISPQMQKLFPHVSPFCKVYVLRFPRRDATGAEVIPPAGGRLLLTLTSGLGKAELVWEITP